MSIPELSDNSAAVTDVCCVLSSDYARIINALKAAKTNAHPQMDLVDYLVISADARDDIHLLGIVLHHLVLNSAWDKFQSICQAYRDFSARTLFHGEFQPLIYTAGQAVGREGLCDCLKQHYDHEVLRRQMVGIRDGM